MTVTMGVGGVVVGADYDSGSGVEVVADANDDNGGGGKIPFSRMTHTHL